MTPGQRRTLWLCTFGLTYIFWYEASGAPLFWKENAPSGLQGAAARAFFWEHLGFGAIFLVFGALLTVVLRKKEAPPRYHWVDWAGLAVGLGVLIGTAWNSYVAAHV